MLILGINASYHDTAAVILKNGQVVAAAEEERFIRVKHTNAFPVQAIQFCVNQAGVPFEHVDLVAVNIAEESVQRQIEGEAASQSLPLAYCPRSYVSRLFGRAGFHLASEKVRFVPHHVAHAASAMGCSGFDEALVVSLDGYGDDSELEASSGIVFAANGADLRRLRTMTKDESLGLLYGQITKLLGFQEFDEYKVMGLAPYGDRETYHDLFAECSQLTDDGWYKVHRVELIQKLTCLVQSVGNDATKRTEVHRDIAAACQALLERVALHFLKHYRELNGFDKLALAGGVALNCALNGKVAAAGLFKDVFVQPASHDAGGALGAALYVLEQERPRADTRTRLGNVYWGSPLPAPYQIEQSLRRWEKFVEWSHSDQIARLAASSLADGSVIGWVQSRSEFGPRALGNRSILADPRPAENRDIVNGMIKQRESFRPFAPSVLAEKASDYFDIPEGYETLPFMLFLVPVRPEQRAKLGAITHVDGTARVHTVTKNANHKYWELIQHFGDLTGIYMLLNTSFNNSAEPIVESVEDAVIAFITTGLHYLVIDDYWIAKREISDDLLLDCSLAIAPCAEFGRTGTSAGTKAWARYRHEPALAARKPTSITKLAFDVVCESDGTTPLRTLLAQLASDEDCGQAIADIRKLWWQRLIQLNTAACQAAAM